MANKRNSDNVFITDWTIAGSNILKQELPVAVGFDSFLLTNCFSLSGVNGSPQVIPSILGWRTGHCHCPAASPSSNESATLIFSCWRPWWTWEFIFPSMITGQSVCEAAKLLLIVMLPASHVTARMMLSSSCKSSWNKFGLPCGSENRLCVCFKPCLNLKRVRSQTTTVWTDSSMWKGFCSSSEKSKWLRSVSIPVSYTGFSCYVK